MNELNHINGKGDKDRSPGWRQNYADIAGFGGHIDGFRRINFGRLRKSYGDGAARGAIEIQTPIKCDSVTESTAASLSALSAHAHGHTGEGCCTGKTSCDSERENPND